MAKNPDQIEPNLSLLYWIQGPYMDTWKGGIDERQRLAANAKRNHRAPRRNMGLLTLNHDAVCKETQGKPISKI